MHFTFPHRCFNLQEYDKGNKFVKNPWLYQRRLIYGGWTCFARLEHSLLNTMEKLVLHHPLRAVFLKILYLDPYCFQFISMTCALLGGVFTFFLDNSALSYTSNDSEMNRIVMKKDLNVVNVNRIAPNFLKLQIVFLNRTVIWSDRWYFSNLTPIYPNRIYFVAIAYKLSHSSL